MYVCFLLIGLGTSAGLFDTPLASYLQFNSPVDKRGTLLSATNCLAFTGILLINCLLFLFGRPTFEGSVSNLPPAVTTVGLSEEQAVVLASAKAEFLKTSIDSETSGVAPIVAQLDESIRPAAITELVMADYKRREEDLDLFTYWDEFKLTAEQKKKLPSKEISQINSKERAIG